MQFWPRKRAKRIFARVRSWKDVKEAKLLGFAGYKAGMTHCIISDNNQNSLTKGEDIFCPATVIECPPIKIASIRLYKKTPYGLMLHSEIFSKNVDKELERRVFLPKKDSEKKLDSVNPEEYSDIRVLIYTQPKLTGIGKKKPELFEMQVGGSLKEKFEYAKNNFGKEINAKDILREGMQVDIHAITKGKGFQGPVKRFGISIRQKKSEKTKRGPGSLGAWHPHHTSYRAPQAGKMGYHTRTEYNKWVLRIGKKGEEVNPKGGFVNYGLLKNPYVLVKGSIPGEKKRLIRLNFAIRSNKHIPTEAPPIAYVSTRSKQGN